MNFGTGSGPDASRLTSYRGQRVLVLGNSCSGKSTLARALGERWGLPVVHLDEEYWQPEWVALSGERFDARVAEVIATDAWIIDGNYSRNLRARARAADTIVFLDLPTHVCFARFLMRPFHTRAGRRAGMPAGCKDEYSFDMLSRILSFNSAKRQRLLSLLEESTWATPVVISNRIALNALLDRSTK